MFSNFILFTMHNHANMRIIYEETIGQVFLGPLLGKQNIQAKEVYCSCDIVLFFFSFFVRYNTVCFNFLLLISLSRFQVFLGNR